jgi:hypothetical protein
MLDVIARCAEADFVIIDGSPILTVADSLVLSTMVDAVLFLIDARAAGVPRSPGLNLPAGGRPCRRRGSEQRMADGTRQLQLCDYRRASCTAPRAERRRTENVTTTDLR